MYSFPVFIALIQLLNTVGLVAGKERVGVYEKGINIAVSLIYAPIIILSFSAEKTLYFMFALAVLLLLMNINTAILLKKKI